jgi:hypothetical protein
MRFTQQQADRISAATWLIGFGLLFYFHYWWPGIMFLIGTTSLVQGLVQGRGWYALQGALWTFGIGIWAVFHFNVAIMFVLLGLSVLVGAFIRPPMLDKKPVVDTSME